MRKKTCEKLPGKIYVYGIGRYLHMYVTTQYLFEEKNCERAVRVRRVYGDWGWMREREKSESTS